MKTLLYSFGFLALLISPATCTLDSNGSIIVDQKSVSENQKSSNENSNQNDAEIDPVLIPKKPQS